MHPAFQTLLVLQDRDRQLDRLAADLNELPKLKQRELAKLASDEAAIAGVKAQIQDNRKATDRLELDIQTRKAGLERLKNQQYETRKNDEFTAIGSEITRVQADISQLEDQELLLWEQAETLQARLGEAERILIAHRRGIDADLAKLDERVGNLGARRDEVAAERVVLFAELSEQLQGRYEGLRRRKADPVAEVRAGSCGGCHMKVPRATEIAAHHDDQLIECPNCGRFLYGAE